MPIEYTNSINLNSLVDSVKCLLFLEIQEMSLTLSEGLDCFVRQSLHLGDGSATHLGPVGFFMD